MPDPNEEHLGRPAGHDPRMRTSLAKGIGLEDAKAGDDEEGTLHASGLIECYACGSPIHAGAEIRVTPKGTRHDTCP